MIVKAGNTLQKQQKSFWVFQIQIVLKKYKDIDLQLENLQKLKQI